MTSCPKVLVFSDPHLSGIGEHIVGQNSDQRLRHCFAQALKRHPDADHILFAGDLSDTGTLEGYRELRQIVSGADIPVTYLMGNEDNRTTFRSVFPDVTPAPDGFFQCVLNFGAHRIICLDTLDVDPIPKHSGFLCDARLNWLKHHLVEATAQYTTLVMHHPPVAFGSPFFDPIGLRNRRQTTEILRSYGVDLVITGHVHRSMSGVFDDLAVTTAKSTGFALSLDLNSNSISPDEAEPAGYGIVLLTEFGPVFHTEQVADNPD